MLSSGNNFLFSFSLLLSLCVYSWGKNCSEGICPGNRPRTSNGCCPALKDEVCGRENSLHLQCDAGLGYRCLDEQGMDATNEGTCQGRYNVNATNITQTSVTLTWMDFKPDNYQYEYSLMRIKDHYKENLTEWFTIQCDTNTRFVYSRLEPNSWYFFKVGVWLDPFNHTYANLSETLMVKTKAVEYCTHNGVNYEVGHTFDNNCEQRCTCMENGEFNCTDLCEEQVFPNPEDRIGCEIVRGEGEDCCRLHLVCEHEPCNVSGTIYPHGKEFKIGCKTCQCNDGREQCAYPEYCEKPETGAQCPHPQEIPVNGQCCPQWRCGNTTCNYNGIEHHYGDEWMDEEKCQLCSCGEEVVCHDICTEPVVPENCTSPVTKRSPTGCCNIIECLPPADACLYEGTLHLPGDYFPNSRCELCVCTANRSVECSPRCKPVIPPPPSRLCPNPHVRTDGCCETLWCDRPDINSFIRDLFGTSYSPHSVTLSFNVVKKERTTATNQNFEILYVSSDNITTNLTHGWKKMTFTPQYVHSEDEPLRSPTELLQTTGAIQVDRRIYVTMTGMKADTTYYFKIRAVGSEEHDETVGGGYGFAGAIAVKTLANDEKLTCTGRCKSAEVVMVPSVSCPKPVLVETNNSCCPEWKCYPKDSGCRYKNMVLAHGEQIRDGCSMRCRCNNGTVVCSSVCPPEDHTPRPGCELKKLRDHCCPLWMCTPLTHQVRTVSVTFVIAFRGKCQEPMNTFKNRFQRVFLNYMKRLHVCSIRKELCDTMDVKVKCPVASSVSSRKRRAASEMSVDLHLVLAVSKNESIMNTKTRLQEVVGEFVDVFNVTNVSIKVNTTTYLSTGLNDIIGPLYDCDQGYVFVRNICIEAEVKPTENTIRLNVSLSTVEVSTDSAILKWDPLDQNVIDYVTGLQIEYKEKHYTNWNQTSQMDPHVTRHTLTRLHAAKTYRARLILLMDMEKNNRVSVSMLEFMTKSYGLPSFGVNIDMQEISVSDTSVSVSWTPLPQSVVSQISAMQLTYSDGSDRNEHSKKVEPSSSKFVLDGLDPGTNYAARVEVLFKNGTVARSSTIHFVTGTNTGDTPQSVLIPLVVSAVIVVCAIAIVAVTCCLWRRAKLGQSRDNSFENKTFGIHLENDGKILSVKP